MSNQLVITSGAKVRSLEGVITGTTGVLNSLPINASNGIPQLDSNGKILVSQLPNSVMEYKGTWDAATNTPTLADGTGNQGDVYLCNVAGTVNFGAGPITFYVGDQVIYSGTIWQRASGASGTVTSVAVTESGDALSITGSPITTSGTINIGFAGTSAQYVAGDGSLITFPSTISQAQRLITEVYNNSGATLTKGTVVYINGGQGNLPTVTKAIATGDSTSAQTYGVIQTDITNMNNGYVVVIGSLGDIDTQAYTAGTQLYLSSTTAGEWTSTKQYAPAHLVYVGIVVRSHPTQGVVEIRIQNGFELDELHNVSAQTPSNNQGLFYNSSNSLWENKSIATALGYTPANDSLVVHLAGDETITGDKIFNGSNIFNAVNTFNTYQTRFTVGIAINQTLSGGAVSGHTVLGANTSGLNVNFPGGGYNSLNFASTSVGNTYTFPNATGTLALTSNIPTVSGTTNYVSKFTGSTSLGNSIIYDNGTSVGIGTATPTAELQVVGTGTVLVLGESSGSTGRQLLFGIDGSTGKSEIQSVWQGTGYTSLTLQPAGGNVGIGTTSPSRLLSLGGTAYIDMVLKSTSASGASGGGTIYFGNSSTDSSGIINYEHSSNYMNFFTAGSERMRITSGGNVGIGTSSPSYLLDVNGTTRFNGSSILNGTLNLQNSGTTYFQQYIGGGGDLVFYNTTNNGFYVYTNSAARLSILGNGNVGIGTSSPSNKLHVVGANGVIANFVGASGNYGQIYSDTNAAIFGASSSTSLGINYLYINPSSNFQAFITNDNERMRITSGGLVLIGTTSSNGAQLQVNGDINSLGSGALIMTQARDLSNRYGFYGTVGTVMNFYSSNYGIVGNFNATTGIYTPTSDINKKKDFEDSTIGLNAILGLKPTLYRMKTDSEDSDKQLGFIAQEVKEFIPQAYVENDDMIGLSDRPIIAALVKAIQEQQKQIEELKAKIK